MDNFLDEPGAAPLRPGAATRARLLRAAVELIGERGWAGVSTRLIAERAVANHALVQYYFGSKAALLAEAVASSLAADLAEPARLLRAAPTLVGGLSAMLGWLDEYDVGSPSAGVFVEALVEARRNPELHRAMAAVLEGLRGLLEGRIRMSIEAGEVRAAVDPRGLAILIAASIDGLLLHRALGAPADVERASAALSVLLDRPFGARDS